LSLKNNLARRYGRSNIANFSKNAKNAEIVPRLNWLFFLRHLKGPIASDLIGFTKSGIYHSKAEEKC